MITGILLSWDCSRNLINPAILTGRIFCDKTAEWQSSLRKALNYFPDFDNIIQSGYFFNNNWMILGEEFIF